MPPFTKQDLNPMSWEELSGLINELTEKIKQSGEKFHVIAPLLRTGGIIGGMLAVKLKTVPMLPLQFKYSYNPTTIRQIISLPDILVELPNSPHILLCEGNTSTGTIASKGATIIKEKYPDARISLATLTKVFGGPEKFDGIKEVIVGRMTNEMSRATQEEKEQHNLRDGITIFPWENAEEELADINAIE